MEKPCVCILAEAPELKPVRFEVVLVNSRDEAKTIFRTLPISCFVVPLNFKGKSLKPFLEWFRWHFPKVFIVLSGRKLDEDELRLKKDNNLIFLPSNRPDLALEAAERALQKRAFTLDLKAVWPEIANCSSTWLRKALKYLQDDMKFLHIQSVQEIADHFGITEPYLIRSCNSYFPFSLKQFLLLSKLCYAAWLKDTTTLPAEAVASQSGFASCSHLSHTARKYLGAPLSGFLASHSWQEVLPRGIYKLKKNNT